MPHAWETRWVLGERLGKGGQGVTHVATFRDDPTVKGALKYLKNIRDQQARGRMRREVANLQTLANAGGAVPRVLDHNTGQFEEAGTDLYVVMDLIQGPTLREHVEKNGALSVDTAIKCVLSLCETIRIAHTFPILHRDLKPDNVIVRDPNDARLIIVDYGLSFNASDDDLTQTDETFRNRFLDLPETNTPTGDRRDPRSDITAVSAILYFCLTTKIPGQLQDGSGTLPHLRTGHSLRDFVRDERITAIEEFLTRAFAPNIANRYQQIEEVQQKLSTMLDIGAPIDESDPIQIATSFQNYFGYVIEQRKLPNSNSMLRSFLVE